jgi:hypothetical protein
MFARILEADNTLSRALVRDDLLNLIDYMSTTIIKYTIKCVHVTKIEINFKFFLLVFCVQ